MALWKSKTIKERKANIDAESKDPEMGRGEGTLKKVMKSSQLLNMKLTLIWQHPHNLKGKGKVEEYSKNSQLRGECAAHLPNEKHGKGLP